ncbi:MAG: hypothetical protein AAF745_14325 [Planctomycetota bacterium]
MSLKITYDELRRHVGRHLGFDRSPSNWEADQATDVADIVRDGVRGFYWPKVDGVSEHKWSFLCPIATVTMSSDLDRYDLPEDFVRLCNSFTFKSEQSRRCLDKVDEKSIRSMADRNGVPLYFAIRPKPQAENRYEMLVHPTPDDEYTLEYRYEKSPPELGDGNPEHLGSAAHSQTLLLSCIASAERTLNVESSMRSEGGINIVSQFQAALLASIALDQQVY